MRKARAVAARGIAVFIGLASTGFALAAPLAAPALASGEDIRRETGEITVNSAPVSVIRYTWRDSAGLPRSVSLVPASGATSGYAAQMSYQVFDAAVARHVYVAADPGIGGGFGYFVSHELYRSYSDATPDNTIAALHNEDDSPFGRYLPSTGSDASVGQHQAVHEYRLSYPRWGTVATIADPSTGTISPNSVDHQKFALPVVIRWTFVAGQDYPLWSVDYDLSAASDHISTDVRGPYGAMTFNEGVGYAVTALRWGDKYKFVADAGAQDFGTAAAPAGGLAWTWNVVNDGRRYNVLSAGTYELGVVDTVLRSASKYADGYSEHRTFTSAMGGCGYGMLSMPCDYEWGYQSFQYDYGPPARPKLAWGSSPFLGSSITAAWNGVEPETLDGKGHISYGVHIVMGRTTPGAPLSLARAAAAMQASPALTVAATPATGGTVAYAVLGDAAGPYADAGRTLAPWTSVRFVATPAARFRFTGWSGGCAGVAGTTCIAAMDAPKAVTAAFAPDVVARTDFNGDGESDLLWRNASTGQVYRMLMNGFTITSGAVAYTEPDTAWSVVGDADFNGDGVADLLWRNSATGQVYVMLFSSSGMPASGAIVASEPNPAWKIVHTPDLDGDGRADLLWWNSSTGQVYAMLMNGASVTAQGFVYTEPNTAWSIAAVGDFAGSGKSNQLLWRNGSTGQLYLMTVGFAGGVFSQSGTMIYQEPNTSWKVLAAPDLDGDGRSDILWRNDATGQVYAMLMNGATIASQALIYSEPNLAWKIVAQGDYNGDGKADLLWRNESTGQVYMLQMSGLMTAGGAMVYTEPNTAWKILGPWEYAR